MLISHLLLQISHLQKQIKKTVLAITTLNANIQFITTAKNNDLFI